MQKPYIVIAMLKAKQEKEAELKNALTYVAKSSRDEKTCLEYRLHQDLNQSVNFILYESWESKDAHQLQFQKIYIMELMEKLEDLLAEPYQILFAEEIVI